MPKKPAASAPAKPANDAATHDEVKTEPEVATTDAPEPSNALEPEGATAGPGKKPAKKGTSASPAATPAATGDEPDGDGDDTPENTRQPKKGAGSIRKRINRLTREKYEAQAQAQALARRVRELEAGKPDSADTGKPGTTEAVGEKPKEADFENHDEYIEALTDWKVAAALAKRQPQPKPQPQGDDSVRTSADTPAPDKKVLQKWKAFEEQGEDIYEDFYEAVHGTFELSPYMLEAAVEHDTAHEIVYYLANNPDKAAEIAALSPVKQAKAIDKLADEVAAAIAAEAGETEEITEDDETGDEPAAPAKASVTPIHRAAGQESASIRASRRVTQAPNPIKPVDGGASVEKHPDKMSQSEYEQWRRKGGGRG